MWTIPLLKDEALNNWRDISHVLMPAMRFSGGKYNIDDCHEMVESGVAQVWVAMEDAHIIGAMITQIVDYPQKSMLVILCLAGKRFDLWDNIVDEFLIPYARKSHCAGIEFLGRKGWERRAKGLGFHPVHILYERNIKEDSNYATRTRPIHDRKPSQPDGKPQ